MTDDRFVLKPTAYVVAWPLALAVYAASFLLPFETGGSGPYMPGWHIFWLGMLYCWYPWCIAWWANVLFWSALGASGETPTGRSFVLAALAFLLAGVFALQNWPSMPGPAYWAWLGSMGVLALGLGVSFVPSPRPYHEDEEWRDLGGSPPAAPGDDRLKQAR